MPTSTGLTDGFDAPTEAPTDWNMTGIEGVEGRDYTISIAGYQPFIQDMERRMEEEDSIHEPPIDRPFRSSGAHEGRANNVRGSEVDLSRTHSLRSYVSKDKLPTPGRHNAGQLAKTTIVEEGASGKIATWRERVAQSQESSFSVSNHRRKKSSEASLLQPPTSKTGRSSDASKSKGTSKGSSGDYERTEVRLRYYPHDALFTFGPVHHLLPATFT